MPGSLPPSWMSRACPSIRLTRGVWAHVPPQAWGLYHRGCRPGCCQLLEAPHQPLGVLCAPAGITAENLVIPMVWRVSQPLYVHMSGQCGDTGSPGLVHVPQERAFCQHLGRGVSLLCEASGKEKKVSQPFPPLLYLSQFFSGHPDLQIHGSYLTFVGESMELCQQRFCCFPAGFKCLGMFSNCDLSFFMMAL